MPIIKTDSNRILLKKAESMCLVPYVYDANVEDYVLGDTVYDISAIIGDSITLEQEDGETTSKENEFTGNIIVENVTAGKMAFSAQCLDMQDKVLELLFGAYTAEGVNGAVDGIVAFPDDFVLQYALIRIRFRDSDTPDVILPKVQMNSKLLLQQMKTRGSQGNVNGTVLNQMITIVDNTTSLLKVLEFGSRAIGNQTYAPNTPVLFLRRQYSPMILHHQVDNSDEYVFSTVDFSTGEVSHNYEVNISDGSYSIIPSI